VVGLDGGWADPALLLGPSAGGWGSWLMLHLRDGRSRALAGYRYPDAMLATRKGADEGLVRTLVALRREQHEWLRTRAFHARTSIASEVRELVRKAMVEESSRHGQLAGPAVSTRGGER
jgi:hypothetical protein